MPNDNDNQLAASNPKPASPEPVSYQAPSQPQPEPQTQPYVVPPNVPTQKSSKLLWMIIATVVVSIVAIVSYLLLTQSSNQKDTNSTSQSETNNQATAPKKLTTFENERTSFSYPSSWKRDNLENITIIADGTVFDKANFTSEQDVAMNYRMMGIGKTPSDTLVERSRRLDSMNTAVANYDASSTDKMISLTEIYGFGCIEDFEYASKPAVVSRGEVIGVQFDYTCTGMKGEATTNRRFQWYDTAGVRHLLTVSAKTSYWKAHTGELTSITESVKIKPLTSTSQ